MAEASSGTSIGSGEKSAVKEQLLRLVKAATEGGLPHLVELTLVLRRVCRFDFPMQWEALTRFLVEELQAQRQRGFSESALAVVLVLHQVLKEQSTKRLMSSRREFHHVGKELIEAVGGVWALKMEHLKQLQHQGSLVNDRFWRLSRHLDGSFLLLLVHGVPHVHEHPTGPQMIQMVKDQVETLLVLLQTHSQQLIQCLTYHSRKFGLWLDSLGGSSAAAEATKASKATAVPGNLLEAVKRKDAKRSRHLLELGVAVAPRDQLLRSPLHLSAAAGEEHLTRLLLAFHADPDVVDAQQRTPLHHAALQGHSAVALALLQNGASAKLRDEEGDRPLRSERSSEWISILPT
eukprot:s91_g21.t3